MNNPEKKNKNNEWSRSIIRHPTPTLQRVQILNGSALVT